MGNPAIDTAHVPRIGAPRDVGNECALYGIGAVDYSPRAPLPVT